MRSGISRVENNEGILWSDTSSASSQLLIGRLFDFKAKHIICRMIPLYHCSYSLPCRLKAVV